MLADVPAVTVGTQEVRERSSARTHGLVMRFLAGTKVRGSTQGATADREDQTSGKERQVETHGSRHKHQVAMSRILVQLRRHPLHLAVC